MTSKSDIDHWHINAKVYQDRVEELHYISDPTRNIRRQSRTKVWQVKQYLGHGGCGVVRLEENQEDGKKRAVKRIRTTIMNLSNSECEKELKALLEFSKPKFKENAVFVEFFGWFKDGPDVFLAMEYMPLGDLESNVIKHSGKILESEAGDIIKQILTGLEIMHAESFAHRDLKPQNILVVNGSPQWWVKLADFGLSKKFTETTAYRTRSGTPSYMAPETLNYAETGVLGSEYTNAVDVWAVGCIAYRLLTGTVSFPQLPSLLEYCTDKLLFPNFPLSNIGITGEGTEFIQNLLAIQPVERPSVPQALSHTWITSGSNSTRRSEAFLSPNQETFGLSEDTSSTTNYNTATHDGLKSYQLPLSSYANPSYTESSLQPHPTSNSNKSDGKMSSSLVIVASDESQANATSSNDHHIETSLFSAASNGHVELVEFLLGFPVDHTITHENGWTPLNMAASKGYLEIVELLLAKGADLTIVNRYGFTPLNSASFHGHADVVKLLLAKGADITIATTNGFTPLNSAAYGGHTEIIELLLAKGADLTIANIYGFTPLNSAAIRGHARTVEFLLAKGADLTVANAYGFTPLNSAAYSGHVETVKLLLAKGADPTIANADGSAPLNSAACNGHLEVVKILLRRE